MSEDFERLLLDRFDKALEDIKKRVWKTVVWTISIFGALIVTGLFWSGVMYATVKNVEKTVDAHINSEAATVKSISDNVEELKNIVITNKAYIDLQKNNSNGKGKD